MSLYSSGSHFFSNFPLKLHPITSVMYIFALIYIPHLIKRKFVVEKLKKTSKPYTIATSKASTTTAADNTPEGIFISKCVSCHQNHWEGFTYYSATIAFCMITQVPTQTVKGFAGFFLINRIIYTVVYLSHLNGPIRTWVWFIGLFSVLFMMAYAAHTSDGMW